MPKTNACELKYPFQNGSVVVGGVGAGLMVKCASLMAPLTISSVRALVCFHSHTRRCSHAKALGPTR